MMMPGVAGAVTTPMAPATGAGWLLLAAAAKPGGSTALRVMTARLTVVPLPAGTSTTWAGPGATAGASAAPGRPAEGAPAAYTRVRV